MIFYLMFCLTTATYSLWKHWFPLMNRLLLEEVDNEITDSPWIGNITYFVLSFVAAPLLFFTVISSSVEERFIEGMYNSLSENLS